MSIALDIFCFSVPLTMMFDAILSVATSIGGCWWPICAREVLMDVTFCQFSNNPPNSNSVADAMTFLIILNYTCTGKFSRALLVLVCWIFP